MLPTPSDSWLSAVFRLQGVSGSRAYIATQGPLPHTVLDFLRMLWEYNIKVWAACHLWTQHIMFLSKQIFACLRGKKKKKRLMELFGDLNWPFKVMLYFGTLWFLLSCLALGCSNGLSGIWAGKGNAILYIFTFPFFFSLNWQSVLHSLFTIYTSAFCVPVSAWSLDVLV